MKKGDFFETPFWNNDKHIFRNSFLDLDLNNDDFQGVHYLRKTLPHNF